MGAAPPCAFVMKTRPSATTGVGTGMSPPPVSRQTSFPVVASYPPMCFHPFTITWVRPPSAWTVGVLKVGTSLRAVRHSSRPLAASKAARKESFWTSAWTTTLPS